jgi:hypothetical protein
VDRKPPSPPLPPRVDAFRVAYRAAEIGPRYTGVGHFALTSLVSLSVIGFALSRLTQVLPLEWLTLPATFVFANLAEYLGHRGPMHHARRGLRLLFERHTRQHHQFFAHDAMSLETTRDLKMVLFPPVMLLFFLGALATPVGLLLAFVCSQNVAWLFVATAVGYFLTYEWLHTSYHLRPDGLVARLPGLRYLRRHHTTHHDPRQMTAVNFNITFPIGDLVFGTLGRGWRAEDDASDPAALDSRGGGR